MIDDEVYFASELSGPRSGSFGIRIEEKRKVPIQRFLGQLQAARVFFAYSVARADIGFSFLGLAVIPILKEPVAAFLVPQFGGPVG